MNQQWIPHQQWKNQQQWITKIQPTTTCHCNRCWIITMQMEMKLKQAWINKRTQKQFAQYVKETMGLGIALNMFADTANSLVIPNETASSLNVQLVNSKDTLA